MERVEHLIVGGGIAGLATAWWLARRGARSVLLLERNARLGREASAQNAAILRTADEDEVIEELALAGARFLREPPAGFARGALLAPCGLIVAVAPDGAASWERRLRARPEEVRELSPATAARVAPLVAPPVPGRARRTFHLQRDGVVDLDALVEGFAGGARALGVRIATSVRVARLLPGAQGVELADGRAIEAEQVALCAGAWAGELARAVGSRVALQPTRRHLWLGAPDARVDPAGPVVWDDADPFYARPERGGLLACGCDEEPVEPDRLSADSRELASVRERLAARAPEFEGHASRAFWAGIRTHAADRRFAIGRDPDLERLVWVAALGGHGIGCAAAVGELASEALLERGARSGLLAALDPARLVRAPHASARNA